MRRVSVAAGALVVLMGAGAWLAPADGGTGMQLVIGVLSLAVAGIAVWVRQPTLAAALVCVVVAVDLVHAQPFPVASSGVGAVTIPAEALTPSVHAEAIRADLAPLHQRVVALSGSAREGVVPGMWARLWKIPSLGGYGPMLLERHSLAALMGRDGAMKPRTLAPSDRVIDAMALRFLLVQPDDLQSQGTFVADGVTWERAPLDLGIGRERCNDNLFPRSAALPLPRDIDTGSVELIMYLRCAETVPQGTLLGTIDVVAADGRTTRKELRAGVDLSEAALADPGVSARAAHSPVASVGDPDAGERIYTHLRIPLASASRLDHLRVAAEPFRGWLTVARVSVVDSGGTSHPQVPAAMYLQDASRWREVRTFQTWRATDRGADQPNDDERTFRLFENRRAQPRAWMVGTVRSLADEEALATLRTGQLPDGSSFDPAATAIAADETAPSPPSMPAGSGDGTSRVTIREAVNGRFTMDVESTNGGFVVLSEAWYPGWRARVDGNDATLYRTNLTMQGTPVPPGRHHVEFLFESRLLQAGAAVSVLSWLVIAGLIGAGVRGRANSRA